MNEQTELSYKLLNTINPKKSSRAVIPEKEITPVYDIAIIVPCYNAESFIEKCLDSILSQNTPAKYIIKVVNDGSTDNSGVLLKQYENDNRVKIITQENRGHSGARNRALNTLDSKYVLFVDSDDYLPENALEKLYSAAEENEADIVEGRFINLINDEQYADEELQQEGLSGYIGGKLISTKLFKNVVFPEGYWYEDSIVEYLLIPRCNKPVKINEPVYVYRRNSDGITATSKNDVKCIDTLWITELMCEEIKSLGIELTLNLYESFLCQISLNYIRTGNMQPGIKAAVFYYTADWFCQNLNGFKTDNKYLKLIVSALLSGDYNLYEQACTMAWEAKCLGMLWKTD